MSKISAVSLLSLALLSACSSTSPTAQAPAAARFAHIASVQLEPGDTAQALAKAVGGEVLEWKTSGCAADDSDNCVALIGFNQKLGAQNLRALGGRTVFIEPNRDVFSGGGIMTATMGGKATMWAGGKATMWAGGKATMWAGGQFAPIPENTALWQKIGLQQAQLQAPQLGAGVTVAVIDTGVDLVHPAFTEAFTDPSTWRDFYADDGIPQEEGSFGVGGYGHGTNITGIILQVAPGVKIMPLRVLGPDGSGDVIMVAQAIEWAVAQGAQLINLSLGSTEESKVIGNAIKKASKAGVVVVSSAGNDNKDRITYPAARMDKEWGVSVGSVNLNDVKSTFSNYAKELDIVAPGEQVYAPAPEGRMAAWSGTSMAAPMVTGGLALELSKNLNKTGKKDKDKADKVIEQLLKNTKEINEIADNKPFKDKLGKGRLDLVQFLNADQDD
ncbi:S8 family peptidase [Deinococcus aerophilus]|uniref:Serine protease n=1 Tax=Deinococcus aerophilus TaxID=522488 RepID=A0ABQ2GIP2_9DEIO|nr:S8 family serine peptidase [Deinococcus aerophilus]GGL98388.1 serine protease [Deinococcus aerophilus]